ncbi:uncharacterized protein STEHIDRAFT_159210 [Stereum hirsutum FP-91666 SS1]|uniref:uncharacterized protein n=1 Tax=Stereum hirsutum (strain FP-91666) TaxID=721885 RepID=UPI000444A1E7|nr:uncharacterized protein STEHIDRAFT_159210 [Stereum hirsutum FP-91666 SS1]EIM84543.1 hypothetical protein STEHIDRAFT_159210 [Stereum hirsutum FP-91666 SS1]
MSSAKSHKRTLPDCFQLTGTVDRPTLQPLPASRSSRSLGDTAQPPFTFTLSLSSPQPHLPPSPPLELNAMTSDDHDDMVRAPVRSSDVHKLPLLLTPSPHPLPPFLPPLIPSPRSSLPSSPPPVPPSLSHIPHSPPILPSLALLSFALLLPLFPLAPPFTP